MKKLTCRDLGGPCDMEITGDSFQEVGKKSRDHVMEQINNGDEAHKAAADKMRNASPEEQKSMMAEFSKRFNEAPNI
jgi:predicted small metal-binding protein